MIKVAGLWEMGWITPITEMDIWEYPLRDFEVSEHYMCPISGIAGKPVTEKATIAEIIDENPTLTVVWVDETATTPLKDFIHPENALYIMGKTSSRPMVELKKEGDLEVRIETRSDGSNGAMLWAHQAISIVLYDRLKKTWQ